MTNDNPKCKLCNGSGYVTDGDYETGYEHIDCPDCKAKPLLSEPSCEHDKGQWWNNEETKAYFQKSLVGIQKSLVGNICPFCKSVEPSVEAFDAGLIQEIYDYCDYRRKVSGVAMAIVELIKERKKERNRK